MPTASTADLASPVVGPYVERFFRGGAPSTREHLQLLAVATDMVQSAFASRTHLYERLPSGEPDAMRARLANRFDPTSLAERVRRFLDEPAPAVSPPVGAPAE